MQWGMAERVQIQEAEEMGRRMEEFGPGECWDWQCNHILYPNFIPGPDPSAWIIVDFCQLWNVAVRGLSGA